MLIGVKLHVSINGTGHMNIMATMPIHGKNLKNLLLWNPWNEFNESLNVYLILGTLAYYSLYHDLCLALTFTGKSEKCGGRWRCDRASNSESRGPGFKPN